MTRAEFATFANAARWTFAKTIPEQPHWYTLRLWSERRMFERAMAFIREHGYESDYCGRRYTYYELEGMKYWTMGASIAETTVINRAHADPERT